MVELSTVSILTLIEVGISAIPGVVLSFLTIPMQVSPFLFLIIHYKDLQCREIPEMRQAP